MIRRIAVLALMAAFVMIVRMYPYGDASGIQGAAAFSLGFVILGGYVAGEICKRLSLPRITGYLVAGIAAGPDAAGWLTDRSVSQLTLIDQIALSLIALSAGGELRLKTLKKQWKGVTSITLCQTIGVYVLGAAAFMALGPFFPIFGGAGWDIRLQAALVFGAVSVAQSPATAIALIVETRSRGPATELALGSAVLKDVLVIVLFTLTLSIDHMIEGVSQLSMRPFIVLGGEMILSILFGLVAGYGLAFFFQRVKADPVLYLLAFSYLVYVGSHSIHLDPILICVVAGLVSTNVSDEGQSLMRAVEKGSLVIYVIFFCVAGAALDLTALRSMALFSLILVGLRMALLWGTTWSGLVIAGVPHAKPSTYWMAFLPQAGVSLGLVTILNREGFIWGDQMATLLIACIALNQIIGPVLMKYALVDSGETGGGVKPGRNV